MQITFETDENGNSIRVTTRGSTVIREIDRTPGPSRSITLAAFLDRFTEDELDDVVEARATVKKVAGWYARTMVQASIDLDDPKTVNGLQRLKTANLLNNAAIARIRA